MEPRLIAVIDLQTKYINERNAHVWESKYMSNNSTALFITDEAQQPLCKLSVNLEEYQVVPEEGRFYAKTYDENEGVMEALIEAGIIKQIRFLNYRWTTYYECEILA